ncbi:MAG: MraY family glycosyltransferase, partial [Planctomycetota bacterium]
LATGNEAVRKFLPISFQMKALAVAAGSVFLMGLADDIWGLRARTKFFIQLLSALTICAAGIRMETITLPGLFQLQLGIWSWPLTCFWIVSISNALNLIDGLDGLAGGISLLACAATAVIAWQLQLFISLTGLVVLMGALSGFLVFNIHPARVFLGDCGALFLGLLLAEASLETASHGGTLLGMGTMTLVLCIPILDVCSSVGRRLLQRRSIGSPDRQHIHHRMLDAGLSHPQVVFRIHLATAIMAGLSMFLIRATSLQRIGIVSVSLCLVFLLFRRVCTGSLANGIRTLGHNLSLWSAAGKLRRIHENGQLRMRLAEGFYPWWNALCDTSAKMGVARLGMTISSRTGQDRSLVWGNSESTDTGDSLHVEIPVRHRRPGPMLWLRAEIPVSSGTELAGRVAARLTRLLEENSIAEIPSAGSRTDQHGQDGLTQAA